MTSASEDSFITELGMKKEGGEDIRSELPSNIRALNCLYTISGLLGSSDIDLEQKLQRIVRYLPGGCAFPEESSACIRLGDRVYKTDHYVETAWQRSADIELNGELAGKVQVFYSVEMVHRGGSLLEDDTKLVNAVAERVGKAVEAERTKEALRESEERFKLLFENLPIGAAIVDTGGRFLALNQALARFLGYSREELAGASFIDFLHPDHKPGCVPWYLSFVETFGDARPSCIKYLRKDRKDVLGRLTVSLVYDRQGQPKYAVLLCEDITEQIRQEEERLRLLKAFEQVEESILITDSNAKIQYANPAFEKLTGYYQEEVLGKDFLEVGIGVSDGGHRVDLRRALFSGKVWKGGLSRRRKDGSAIQVLVTLSPVRDDEGHIWHYVAVERDVTKDMEKEKHDRQAQKMQAIGTLAAGIAHDFNNILGSILLNTELVLADIARDSPHRGFLREVMRATYRAKDLVEQILTFSRQRKTGKAPYQIAPMIKEVLKLLRASLPSSIEIRHHVTSDDVWVEIDPADVHHLLVNLCSNAAHAMQGAGGVLNVWLGETVLDAETLEKYPDLSEGSYCVLSVSDTGSGIEPHLVERIFEPFFTTKNPGEGSGMGLAVVHGIVESYNGAIEVGTAVGKGTTFRVFLPKAPVQSRSRFSPLDELPRGRERVLFVDDEELLVNSAKQILGRLGYQVTCMTNGLEALQLFKSQPEAFDVVVTDLTMPKMQGKALARSILEIRPDIPIILCTGFAEIMTGEEVREIGVREILAKPISRQELAMALRRVLDANL